MTVCYNPDEGHGPGGGHGPGHGHHGDWIDGGRGDDLIFGGRGDDTIFGGRGDDTIFGGKGDDGIHGGKGDDLLFGGKGDDIIYGDKGDDTVFGDRGDDTIHDGKGDDLIFGNDGDDKIYTGRGEDTVFGGKGDDTIYASGHDDDINGDKGFDVVVYDHSKPHHASYDPDSNTYDWGKLGTAKNVEFQQFDDSVQITVHNSSEAAIARMFHFATGDDPTATQYKNALDELNGGKSVLDVVKDTFHELDHKTAGDHVGNSEFVQDIFHNAGEPLSPQELTHLAGHLDHGDFTKAELLAYVSQNWTWHDEQLGIKIDQSFH
ncbi:MAG: calcium-binding protein [Alsobacter sp.]